MISKPREPKNLEEWLETATKGIAAAGKERITREIEAHYAEAVTAATTGGKSTCEAGEMALRALGKRPGVRPAHGALCGAAFPKAPKDD